MYLNIVIFFSFSAPTTQIFKEAVVHYDFIDADESIKLFKRVNALITAMNSLTPKNLL